jgi:hypothetical protein
MKRTFLVLAASVAAMTAFATTTTVQASPKTDPAQCFRTQRMSNWASYADRVINVKLQTGAVFQVTLVGACPGLGMNQTLAFNTGFKDQVCDGRPATVITRSGAVPLHCAVKTVRALTREEAAALPDAQRP